MHSGSRVTSMTSCSLQLYQQHKDRSKNPVFECFCKINSGLKVQLCFSAPSPPQIQVLGSIVISQDRITREVHDGSLFSHHLRLPLDIL